MSKKTICTILTITFLAIAGGLALYSYVKFWTPIETVAVVKNTLGQTLGVTIKTKVPAKVYAEYGTSAWYLNATKPTQEYQNEQVITVASILPDRKHFVRVVATTENGKEYKSEFYTVE